MKKMKLLKNTWRCWEYLREREREQRFVYDVSEKCESLKCGNYKYIILGMQNDIVRWEKE